MERLFEVIYEDDELLVINKPAGLVCHPTKTDEYSSLISRARLYLGPDLRPQLVNRLDRETSGLTLIAKREGPARQLRQIWECRQVEKEYVAIVHGHVDAAQGTIAAPLGKDERSRVAIKDCVRPDGALASTDYRVEQRFERQRSEFSPESSPGTDARSNARHSDLHPFTLLRILPHTGRKHQIRIHLAHIGHPIVGDKIYGGDENLYLALVSDRLTPAQRRELILPHHALHASQIRFLWRSVQVCFRAEPENWFSSFLG